MSSRVRHEAANQAMNMNWKSFLVGLACGLVIAFLLFRVAGQRYRIEAHGPSGLIVMRLDTWTGDSWMQHYYDKDGRRIWYWERIETLPK